MDRPGLRRLDAEGPALKILRAVLLLALFIPQVASAHIGSKDVFEQVNAGPYKLFVTIRMPDVIPGVANVEVRSTGAPVTELKITPTPITGEASKHPPTPDTMKVSSVDPAFYTGGVWMMSAGSWEIRLDVSGAAGNSTVSVPVPAVAIATLQMQRSLGVPLAILGLFLIVSMAGVIGAAVREARLPAGAPVTAKQKRRGMLATAGGLVVMALMVWGGAKWWHVEAASYADDVYHPPVATAELTGDQLNLKVCVG